MGKPFFDVAKTTNVETNQMAARSTANKAYLI